MGKKVLVIVDVQNDFCKGGVLAYGYPKKSNTNKICELAQKFIGEGNFVVATRDTHGGNYLDTLEGKMLPIKHCIKNTKGWELVDRLNGIVTTNRIPIIDKNSFGSLQVGKHIKCIMKRFTIDEIIVCGYVTEICVLSTIVLLRSMFPNINISILSKLCGSVNEESFNAALTVLKSIQTFIK